MRAVLLETANIGHGRLYHHFDRSADRLRHVHTRFGSKTTRLSALIRRPCVL